MMSVRESFDGAAQAYNLSRSALIPDYKDFFGAALAALPENRKKPYRFLEVGEGSGAFAKLIAKAYPHSEVTVSGFSQPALDEARKKLGEDRRFNFQRLDMLIDPFPADIDVVVSSMAIHHLDHSDKRLVFCRIFKALKPGGVFVNADQLSSGEVEKDQRRFDRWLEAVRAKGVCEKALGGTVEQMRSYDQNAPQLMQVRWLELAGFRNVDITYRKYFWGVFKAVK